MEEPFTESGQRVRDKGGEEPFIARVTEPIITDYSSVGHRGVIESVFGYSDAIRPYSDFALNSDGCHPCSKCTLYCTLGHSSTVTYTVHHALYSCVHRQTVHGCTLYCTPSQYSTVQYSTVQYSAVQYSTVQ